MSGTPFLTALPLRASADIEPCRVIGLSGAWTAAKVTGNQIGAGAEPLGVSAEWTVQPPIPDYSIGTLHARGAQADPVSYHGRGQKAHVVVGATAISAAGRVMAEAGGTGKVIPFVLGAAATWSVGVVGDASAPVGSKVEVFIDPVLHALT